MPPLTKICPAKAIKIGKLRKQGMLLKQIAFTMSVSISTVQKYIPDNLKIRGKRLSGKNHRNFNANSKRSVAHKSDFDRYCYSN